MARAPVELSTGVSGRRAPVNASFLRKVGSADCGTRITRRFRTGGERCPGYACERLTSHFAFVAGSDSSNSMTKTQLRVRAARHGRSMEEEAREILRSALTFSTPAKGNLAKVIRRRFAAFGGVELALPRRDAINLRKFAHEIRDVRKGATLAQLSAKS